MTDKVKGGRGGEPAKKSLLIMLNNYRVRSWEDRLRLVIGMVSHKGSNSGRQSLGWAIFAMRRLCIQAHAGDSGLSDAMQCEVMRGRLLTKYESYHRRRTPTG